MAINLVVADGIVKSPALRYDSNGKPEFRWTLDQQDCAFHLWLPCCASGSAAERLASEIEADEHIVVTSGKLCYRKRQTKAGEHSRLEIFVWSADVLRASPQEKTSPTGEGDAPSLAAIVAPGGEQKRRPSQQGKPRYPKWTGAKTALRGNET